MAREIDSLILSMKACGPSEGQRLIDDWFALRSMGKTTPYYSVLDVLNEALVERRQAIDRKNAAIQQLTADLDDAKQRIAAAEAALKEKAK